MEAPDQPYLITKQLGILGPGTIVNLERGIAGRRLTVEEIAVLRANMASLERFVPPSAQHEEGA